MFSDHFLSLCISDPTWLSTNLGILTCIECSGIHRELGVHYSRIQSLTLDFLSTSELLVMNAILETHKNVIWPSASYRNNFVSTCFCFVSLQLAVSIGNTRFNDIMEAGLPNDSVKPLPQSDMWVVKHATLVVQMKQIIVYWTVLIGICCQHVFAEQPGTPEKSTLLRNTRSDAMLCTEKKQIPAGCMTPWGVVTSLLSCSSTPRVGICRNRSRFLMDR